MNAKIDPKVVKDPFIFSICGWNSLQPTNRKLSKECINENKPRLLIRISSRDSFFMIQYLEQPFVCGNPNVKESKWESRLLTLLCEGLCELPVTLQQQHSAASNDLHEHL